nr:hypothetical protein [Brevundimonas diminuta]
MRTYQRQRRAANPKATMLERARERAARSGLEFSLAPDDIEVPEVCPVLGIPIIVGGSRSGNSPSLDRIRPESGYTAGNVRVISSRANSMKGGRTLSELVALAAKGPPRSREAYALIAAYVDRETLLHEVRIKIDRLVQQANEWVKVERFLDRSFRRHAITLEVLSRAKQRYIL